MQFGCPSFQSVLTHVKLHQRRFLTAQKRVSHRSLTWVPMAVKSDDARQNVNISNRGEQFAKRFKDRCPSERCKRGLYVVFLGSGILAP